MMRYREITEAPIEDIVAIDMDREGTFRADDRKKIQSHAWKERVVKLFSRSPFPITLYLINGLEGQITLRTKHAIDRIDVTKNFSKYVGLHSHEWGESILGHPIDNTGITVMLFQNEGSNRVGLTPWMVGHRIAHTFLENNSRDTNYAIRGTTQNILDIINDIVGMVSRGPELRNQLLYGNEEVAAVAKLLSPFRSARTGTLSNGGEYVVDLLTQFLINGRVTFMREWIQGDRKAEPHFDVVERAILDAAVRIVGEKNADNYLLKITKDRDDISKLYREMKDDPLRPKTKNAMMEIIARIVDEDRLLIPYPKNDAERNHDRLDSLEERLNKHFTTLVSHAMGKVIVL